MSKDIRELFKQDHQSENETVMPKGHEARFLNKLDTAMPEKRSYRFRNYGIAATVVLFIALGLGVFNNLGPETVIEGPEIVTVKAKAPQKSLGDISPSLKKVEDYYIANINLELSRVQVTKENKELFDGYVSRLEILNQEYEKLSIELSTLGPNEQTVDALISNLKLRLNLMYRLKEQLKKLNTIENEPATNSI